MQVPMYKMYHKFLRFPEPKLRADNLMLPESFKSLYATCTKPTTTEFFGSVKPSCSVIANSRPADNYQCSPLCPMRGVTSTRVHFSVAINFSLESLPRLWMGGDSWEILENYFKFLNFLRASFKIWTSSVAVFHTAIRSTPI